MNDVRLECVSDEKDLGVIVSEDLKWEKQCSEAVRKANRMLGIIKRNFVDRSKEMIIPLYIGSVRLTLNIVVKYGVLITRRIKLMEGVQRRATKLITGMHDVMSVCW